MVFDPTNYAKNTLTELHTLQITINQATQISNQLRQLAYEVQNLKNIPNGVWGQIQSDLGALTKVVKVGQSISYADANLTGEFTAMYPGYHAPDGLHARVHAVGRKCARRNPRCARVGRLAEFAVCK